MKQYEIHTRGIIDPKKLSAATRDLVTAYEAYDTMRGAGPGEVPNVEMAIALTVIGEKLQKLSDRLDALESTTDDTLTETAVLPPVQRKTKAFKVTVPETVKSNG